MNKKLALVIPALILIIGIAIAYQMISERRILPVYSPSQLNPELVDEELQGVKRNHRISTFSLIDPNGKKFSEKELENSFYVTDFFFTTCPTICIDMSAQLMRVQKKYADLADFKIVSHTVQPEIDSVAVLKEYAERHDAIPGKWIFLTGDKRTIYNLARKSYFAATTEGDGGINDFIHTENFILVDKEKRIRGYYDGTDKNDVDRLMNDISILNQEYED